MASDNPFFEPLEGKQKSSEPKLFVDPISPVSVDHSTIVPSNAQSSHHTTPPSSSAALSESVLANLPHAVVVLDNQQKVLFSNAAHAALIGVDASKLADGMQGWFTAACPDVERRAKVISSWHEHVWRSQLPRTFTLQSPTLGERQIEFRSSMTPDGQMVVIQEDITAGFASDDSLRLAHLKFRSVFANAEGGVILVSSDGVIEEVNSAFIAFAGIAAAALVGRPFYEILNSDDVVSLRQLESKQVFEIAERPRKLRFAFDGQDLEKPAVVTASYVTNENHDIAHKLFLLKPRDKQLMSKLRELSSKAQALLDAVPDMFVLLDPNGTVNDWSPPAHEWSGVLPLTADCVGKRAGDVWPLFGALLDKALGGVFDQGKTYREVLNIDSEVSQSVTLAPFGEGQALALIEAPVSSAPPELASQPVALPVVAEPSVKVAEAVSSVWQTEFVIASKEAVLVTDNLGEIVEVNPAAAKLLGQNQQALIQSNVFQLLSKAPGVLEDFDLDEWQGLNSAREWKDILSVSASGPQQVAIDVIPVGTVAGQSSQFVVLIEKLDSGSAAKSESNSSSDAHSLAASQFRSQLQIITSLFSIAPQSSEPGSFDAWLVRLKVLAESMTGRNRIGVTYLLRDLADQVSAVAGKGLALREIHIGGPGSLTIDSELATPFALLVGELMYLAVTCPDKGPGPSIYINTDSVDGNMVLTAKPGEGRNLFADDQLEKAKVIEILVEQIRGEVSVGVGDKGETLMRLSFPNLQA